MMPKATDRMRTHSCGARLLPEEWVTGVCPQCGDDTGTQVRRGYILCDDGRHACDIHKTPLTTSPFGDSGSYTFRCPICSAGHVCGI